MRVEASNSRIVSSFPIYSLVLVFVLTFTLFIYLLFYVWGTYMDFQDNGKYFRLSELAKNISSLDDMLAMAAKMAADTGDLKWEKAYLNYEIELNDAITEAMMLEEEFAIGKSFPKVDESNRRLRELGNRAFRLIRNGQPEDAYRLLTSDEYEANRKIFRAGTGQVSTMISSFVKEKCEDYHRESYITLIFAIISIPFLMLSWVSVSRLLRKYDTEREQFQEKLMESERRFRDLTENTSDWIWEINCRLQYTYSNPVIEKILGYRVDEVLGKTIYDFTPKDEIPKLKAFASALIKDPRPFFSFENRNIHRNGSEIILETSGVPVYDSTGEIVGFRGIDRDITSRKEAERALWQEKNLLNRITETSPVGITVMDRDGLIIYANNSAISMFGLTKEKITHLAFNSKEWHMTDFEGAPIPDGNMPFNVVKGTGKLVMNFRVTVIRQDGDRKFLSINAAPLLDTDKKFEGMVSAIENISEQVRSETEMKRLIKELQKALADVQTLSGLLPICASCKKVRDDKGYWSSVEKYIQKRSSVKFSHGFCPECFEKYCTEYFSHEEPFLAKDGKEEEEPPVQGEPVAG